MSKINWKATSKIILGIIILPLLLFTFYQLSDYFLSDRCKKVEINIKNAENYYFINQKDVEFALTKRGSEPLIGKLFEKINLRQLEQRLLQNKQIKSCQVYRGVEGVLNVDIEQYIPVARILEKGCYLSSEGTFFPLSDRYSARILLLSGDFFKGLNNLRATKHEKFLRFINQINEDSFLKSQFSQLEINSAGNITIVPLFGKHLIEFGDASNISNRLNRLKIFYKQILPVKGWDEFSNISVKYNGQIVCK